ncbi:type III secretion protein T [Succinivibrio dextrinosolvens]|nr:type III secretion protein T [Succinivibrio dextrinosolvens]
MDNMISLLLESGNRELVIFVLLAMARLIILISFTPFFAPKIATIVKLPLCVVFILPAFPIFMSQAELHHNLDLTASLICALLFKEVVIGFLIAFISGVFFYAAMAAGMIIDNQRGASQAQGGDLLDEMQNSPFGSVLMLSLVILFYSTGAVVAYLTFILSSYTVWPVYEVLPGVTAAKVAEYAGYGLNTLMATAMVICSPFVIVALMTDISLGLINRFAPQLNVFILSMPIKSGLCATLIVLFIQPYMEIGEIYLNKMSNMLMYLTKLF